MNFQPCRVVACGSLLFGFLAACGGAQEDTGSSREAASRSAASDGLTTGVGSRLEVTLNDLGRDDDGTSYSAEYSATIRYTDVHHYFGRPPVIYATVVYENAHVTTAETTATPPYVTKRPVALLREGKTDSYVGTTPQAGSGTPPETQDIFLSGIHGFEADVVTAVDLAFSTPNGRWDSNLGTNYRTAFDLFARSGESHP